ncbi:hypothetical protein ACJ51O_25045 [Burkholderia pyrrocinia]|uniref:hypothetical protein n=1 Tax=Burkholderia pyrrocinia TaxID=60550 RepID=UPI0038B6AEC7
MKIVKDCWQVLSASECQYGAHIFDGNDVIVYVSHWLAVFDEIESLFFRKNAEGYVGHCQFAFLDIEKFDMVVVPYENHTDGVIWRDPVKFSYSGKVHDEASIFELSGSLQGIASSVEITVKARAFELRILDGDEPAKQS